MEENKIINFEKEKETEGMSEVKKEFVKHLQRARAQGIAIGQKSIALTIMSYIESAKEDDPDSIRDSFEKIKSLCEKTNGFTLEDFVEQMGVFREIADVAEENRKIKEGQSGVSARETEEAEEHEANIESVPGDKDAERNQGKEG